MHDKFKKRKDRIELFKEIEKIHAQARYMHKTASLLNQHCHIFANLSPQIYNMSSVTKYLEQQSDEIFHNLCRLVDSENPPETPEFMKNIGPIPPEIIDDDDEIWDEEMGD